MFYKVVIKKTYIYLQFINIFLELQKSQTSPSIINIWVKDVLEIVLTKIQKFPKSSRIPKMSQNWIFSSSNWSNIENNKKYIVAARPGFVELSIFYLLVTSFPFNMFTCVSLDLVLHPKSGVVKKHILSRN